MAFMLYSNRINSVVLRAMLSRRDGPNDSNRMFQKRVTVNLARKLNASEREAAAATAVNMSSCVDYQVLYCASLARPPAVESIIDDGVHCNN